MHEVKGFMKKLLIVTTVPETLDTILRGQPNYLNNSFRVHIATSNSERIVNIEDNERILVDLVPMVRGINPFYDVYSIFMMVRLLIKIKPDIIHSYTPKAGMVAMISAWLCRIPVRIHTFTGLIFPTSSGAKKKMLILIDRLICLCATRIVPEGEGVKNDLLVNKITTKKLDVIGFGNIAGVDTDYYSRLSCPSSNSLEKSLGLTRESFVFCFVGRLNNDKGLYELVEAFQLLPNNAHLLVVGALDKTAPLNGRVFSELKQHARVHLLGFQEDIRPVLYLSQVLVLPSYREGFPNVLLQAGGMNLPVIATNISGSNEVVNDGFNGWLVPVKDIGQLHSSMQSALETSSEKLRVMGLNARERIVERFIRSKYLKNLKAFYFGELQK